ncbi:MAG: hypothetical protein AAF211_04665 [Myxococcota bacterium]
MTPILLAPLLLGCEDPNEFTFEGITTWNMFPFEQGRVWEYISTDRSLSYKLVAELEGKPDVENSVNVYTVSYNERCVNNDPDCEDFERFRIRWSSTPGQGVRVHTVIDPQGIITFEPPLKVADSQMQLDESIDTVSGGRTWTSSFAGLVGCDTNFPAGWDSCGSFTITNDTVDVPSPVLGTWLASVGNGVATIDFADEEGVWRLSDVDCGTCDGEW